MVHKDFFINPAFERVDIASREVREDVRKIFDLNLGFSPTGADQLTVHIRGGDIFSKRPHPSYAPFPLTFYKWVFGSEVWTKILIVSEDLDNPLVWAVKVEAESFGIPVEIQSSSLRDDLNSLLCAKNLVASQGTFVPAVGYLSKNVENIYTCLPSNLRRYPPENAEIITPPWDSSEYFQSVKPWRASLTQVNTVLFWSPSVV